MKGEGNMEGKVRKVFSTGGLAAARRHAFALLALGAGMVLLGSDKSPLVPRVQSLVRRAAARLGMTRGDAVTPDDIARGYRILDGDGGSILQMPPGSITNEPLRLRGGYDWAFRIERDDWSFPTRDGIITGVTVLARGEVRPDVGTLYFPVPITNGVSLLPQSKWGLLPNGGGSVFSHAVTNDSLLLDWHNALVDRDPNSPTNLQLELRGDGSFVWRTDDASTSYLPVPPFDWDGDGLENSVDPEPLLANPIDAHGTPAEWYRIVCSNVFEIADNSNIETFPDSNIPEGIRFKPEVNSNAYYFVDVVATNGPAPIYFTPDRDSRLGAPVVVALAGETNHIPLLMGIEYSVTSTVPITVLLPEDGFAEVAQFNDLSFGITWPINFSVATSEDGHTITVTVVPYDPGGEFEWEPSGSHGGGAMLMSAAPSTCSYTTMGGCVFFGCDADCSCSGCSISGNFCFEGLNFQLPTVWCGCWDDHHDEPEPTPVGHPDMASTPSLSLAFSHPVVIFEDAYTNTPGDVVGRRSTTNILTISAYGGANGAFLSVNPGAVGTKLLRIGGHHLPQRPVLIPANFDVQYEILYEGQEASSRTEDILVTAKLVAINDISPTNRTAKTTSLRVEVEPEKKALENSCVNRHRFGVCETVKLKHSPVEVNTTWRIPGNAIDSPQQTAAGVSVVSLPVKCQYFSSGLEVECLGVRYQPNITLVEPEGILCTEWRWNEMTMGSGNERKGQAGWVGMYLTLVVTPRDVSFENIDVEETPTTLETHTEYFNYLEGTAYISHTGTAGAGVWHSVGTNNYFTVDEALTREKPVPWLAGSRHVWVVPHSWRRGTENRRPWDNFAEKEGDFAEDCTQTFTLEADGTAGVIKHGKTVTRSTNNCVRVEGGGCIWKGLM